MVAISSGRKPSKPRSLLLQPNASPVLRAALRLPCKLSVEIYGMIPPGAQEWEYSASRWELRGSLPLREYVACGYVVWM